MHMHRWDVELSLFGCALGAPGAWHECMMPDWLEDNLINRVISTYLYSHSVSHTESELVAPH